MKRTKLKDTGIESYASMSQGQAVALLGVRLVFDIRAAFKLANKLVGSHGAHVEAYDPKTQNLILSHLPDPVLAQELKKYLNSFDNAGWLAALPHLRRLYCTRQIDLGHRGELVSQILCRKDIDGSEICIVRHFLKRFVGLQLEKELDKLL